MNWRAVLLTSIALLAASCVPAMAAGGSDGDCLRAATLRAIHALENPRNLQRPGSRGELGPYQFRESTWRMHTTAPFRLALDRKTADAVAVLHYDWIKRGLERAGLPASVYNIALAWNVGLAATIAGKFSEGSQDYAQRVTNLVGANGHTHTFSRGIVPL